MAFKNLGVGPAMQKRSSPPPPVSKGGGGGGLALMDAAGPKGGPQAPDAGMSRRPAPAAAPAREPAPSQGGESIAPEAVCYRSEMETCGNCEFNANGQCSKLKIPVQDGDGCNLFSDRQGGGDFDDAADKYEQDDDTDQMA